MSDSHRTRKGAVWAAAAALLAGVLAAPVALSLGAGTASCGSAVAVWLERHELPLPRLSAGPKDLVIRGTWLSRPQCPADLDGVRRVELWRRGEEDRLVAEYDVGWYGDPARYRLVAATDRLSDLPMNVSRVPELARDDLGQASGRGRFRWNPFN